MTRLRVPVGKERFVTFINVYAGTMTYPEEEKKSFYQDLADVVDSTPRADKLLVLGDSVQCTCW